MAGRCGLVDDFVPDDFVTSHRARITGRSVAEWRAAREPRWPIEDIGALLGASAPPFRVRLAAELSRST